MSKLIYCRSFVHRGEVNTGIYDMGEWTKSIVEQLNSTSSTLATFSVWYLEIDGTCVATWTTEEIKLWLAMLD